MGAVNFRTLKGHAVNGGLDDDVLLGVKAPAKLVALSGRNAQLLTQAADFQAIA